MRTYEIVVIIHPDLEESVFTATIEKIKGWITETGGQVAKVDIWGKRHLAYHIRKQSDGQYVLLQAEMDPASIKELERNLKFLEPVLRYMVIQANVKVTA